VTKVLDEDDDDLHLVLYQGTDHMIAEAPSAACNPGATPYRRNQMKTARAAVKVCAKAEIIGVAFFDFFLHQTGVAPNEIRAAPDPQVQLPERLALPLNGVTRCGPLAP
jgi:hypothetical protein